MIHLLELLKPSHPQLRGVNSGEHPQLSDTNSGSQSRGELPALPPQATASG